MFGFRFWRGLDGFSKELVALVDGLYPTALRLTRNPSDADDLIQETILKAYRFRDQFNEGSNLRAWLFKILLNTYINQYHKDRREREKVLGDKDFSEIEDRYIEEWSESAFGQQRLPFSEEMSDEVLKAMNELLPEYRIVIELVDIQGFSYTEAAEIVGHPVGTVMSRLSRGRAQLKSALLDYARREGYLRRNEPQREQPETSTVRDIEVARKKKAREA